MLSLKVGRSKVMPISDGLKYENKISQYKTLQTIYSLKNLATEKCNKGNTKNETFKAQSMVDANQYQNHN